MSSAKKRRELNRAKEEHDKAKLSAQIAVGNHSMLNMCESVAAQQIATLTRQRDNLLAQVDLAVEALECITGRRIFIDNLASNVDIAVMTLDAIKESEVK